MIKLKRDLTPEKLNEVYKTNYYWYLSSHGYTNTIFKYIAQFIKGKVLDVGCWTGCLADYTHYYVGIDACPMAIREATLYRSDARHSFECLDLRDATTLEDTYFDTIVLGNIIHCLLENPEVYVEHLIKHYTVDRVIIIDLPVVDLTFMGKHSQLLVREFELPLPLLDDAKRFRKVAIYDGP